MSAAEIAVRVLLGICVATAVICCFALVIIRDFYERLHYMASVTTVSAFALLAAIVVKEGWGQATLKTIIVVLVLLLINAVLTHATARAGRVRKLGHWSPQPEENIPGTGGRGEEHAEDEP